MDKSTILEVHKAVSNIVGEGNQINIYNKPKRTPLPPNIMVFQTFAYLAATKLKPSSNQVLMLFFSKSVYEGFIGMDVKTVSEELNITERSVISALNELVENNIIIRVQNLTDKRRNDYFINPMAAWKGNSYARKLALGKIEKIDPMQLSIFGINEADAKFKELRHAAKEK